ncbi:adenylyltransferase/cytidyltransferase family protein [Acinetobacter soli]|uniref:adenylyltransferase/cytidyltransferase family protein n=1 Tax=Acinetobacter soli TaxID=487316 RepID=UPI00124FA225|nr:adenylyltransferase/cytidyltransferase family protein [Acinetobacter soli]
MKKIITYGTFDLFHVGHLNLLNRARSLGDYLVVVLSTDEFNKEYKNKQTIISYNDRKSILESLRVVDLVVPETCWEQKIDDVKKYDIDTFVMGSDWKGHFDFLGNYCNVKYLERTANISSSELKMHISTNSAVCYERAS